MLHPEPWMESAHCQERLDLPWLRAREDVGLGEEASMALVCDHCLVRAECVEFAKANEVSSGFWAGDFRDPPLDAVGGAA